MTTTARTAGDWVEELHPRERGRFTTKDKPEKPSDEENRQAIIDGLGNSDFGVETWTQIPVAAKIEASERIAERMTIPAEVLAAPASNYGLSNIPLPYNIRDRLDGSDLTVQQWGELASVQRYDGQLDQATVGMSDPLSPADVISAAREAGLNPDAERGFAGRYVDQWASSSGDSAALSVAVQVVAREKWGGDVGELLSYFDDSNAVKDELDTALLQRPMISAYLDASFASTQEKLGGWVDLDGTVKLYRGYYDDRPIDTGLMSVSTNPLSSWTTSPAMAASFAENGDYGYVLEASVPVSAIMGMPSAGPGSLEEEELVVLGAGDLDLTSISPSTDAAYEKAAAFGAAAAPLFIDVWPQADWPKRTQDALVGESETKQASARLAYSEDQERDFRGRFGKGEGDPEHRGKDDPYEGRGTGTKDDPIRGITDADEALNLIAEGKYVEMDPDTVAVAIDRLSEIALEAKELGMSAPVYDLCNITSDDTSLFCSEAIVETRLEMPQLAGPPVPGTPSADLPTNSAGWVDITKPFTDSLAARGISSAPTMVDPALLKASQNELNGAKVAGIMRAMQSGEEILGTVMVSSDNYVIDGHHRWAAEAGIENWSSVGDGQMNVVRIDLPIQQVLDEANAFAEKMGIKSQAASMRATVLATAVLVADEYGLDMVDAGAFGTVFVGDGVVLLPEQFTDIVYARLATFDESAHPRDERGRFGEKGDSERATKQRDTKFTSARDVAFADWARQFPKGTVFRAGRPERIEAMRQGQDLGSPTQVQESAGVERINGIWVSDTAKLEYLDTGEVMAAFDATGLKVVNEGAPGDKLLEYVPSARLLGTWTPSPDTEHAPFHERGKGHRGIAPEGRAIAASAWLAEADWDESKHPRDELGRFGEKGDEEPSTTSMAEKILKDNPQQPGENFFDWQGRVVAGIENPRLQSEVIFHSRERYEPVGYLEDGAERWCRENGLDGIPDGILETPVDLREAELCARVWETMPDNSSDPEVRAAYDDFQRQSDAMYDFMTKPESEGGLGITVTFVKEKDPYDTAEAQAADLRDNKHIYLESGLGGDHPLLTTEEYDRFRAVHDVFGHAAIGGGFDRHGEYEAWLMHSAMYTPPGRDAMASEYHGVNSAMWSGAQGSPGTGKAVLLPERFRNPPWERVASVRQAAAKPFGAEPSKRAAAYIEALGLDADFANHFEPCRWHYSEPRPAWLAAGDFDEDKHPRDERGRFTSGDGSEPDVAPLVMARQRQPEDTRPGSKPARNAEILTLKDLTPKEQAKVMAKVTGPIPPVKPEGGWPKDANGDKIVPQPPEGKEWGIDATPEEVRENYEAIFARGMADPENREAGVNWYENTRDQAQELADRYGYDLTEAATAIAAMSAGTRWETEFPILETMMRMDGTELNVSPERLEAINIKLTGLDANGERVLNAEGKPMKGLGEDPVSNGMNLSDMNSAQAIQVMFNEHMQRDANGNAIADPTRIYDTSGGWGARYSYNQYERALDAIRGDMPPQEMNGVKVREFYNNITNPEVDGHVTIDVMMMQIAANDIRVQNETRITGAPSIDSVALGPSPFLADEVRRIAEREGMTANDVQAVMWVQWLDEQKAAGRGGARGGADDPVPVGLP